MQPQRSSSRATVPIPQAGRTGASVNRSSLSASVESMTGVGESPSLAPNFRISLPSMLTDSSSARITVEEDGILANEETSPLIGPSRSSGSRPGPGQKVSVNGSSGFNSSGAGRMSGVIQGDSRTSMKAEVVSGPKRERIESLDVFRGLTVVLMVFVNSPGSWSHMYDGLSHASWDGIEFPDFIFPAFLFIMGNAMHITLGKAAVPDREFYKKLMKRVIILFILGLILNINYDIKPDKYRIMGVLQRISLCYLIVALQVIYLPRVFQYAFNFVYIAIYLGLLLGVDVPGCGRGSLDAECNAAKYIDEQVFTQDHMFPYPGCQSVCGVFEPEGIVGTFTACLNVFAGVLYGQIMDVHKDKRRLMKYWSVIGCAFLLTGVIVNIGMPINKNLWSISFALVTCASSGLTLTLSYFIIDYKGIKKIGYPFIVIGKNPLAIYFLSGFLVNILEAIEVPAKDAAIDSGNRTLRTWIYDEVFDSWMPSNFASFSFAVIYTSLFVSLAFLLDKKKIYIKV